MEYEQFVYSAGHLDDADPIATWKAIRRSQRARVTRLNRAREIRIVAPDTDLTFACKGRKWINCDGEKNFPDGEVFTGPIEDSMTGHIRFAFPSLRQGQRIEDVSLELRKGKGVQAVAEKGNDYLNAMLDMDAGARRVGETALGASIPESLGVNKSAVFSQELVDTRGGCFVVSVRDQRKDLVMGKDKRSGPIAGVDIGGTKIYTLIVDAKGKVLGRGRKKSKADQGFDAVMDRTRKCVEEACDDAGIKIKNLAVVGVGAPSPITEKGYAVMATNMGWTDAPLVPTLTELLGRDVYADNDCNVGAMGEYAFGAGKGSRSLVGLFVGTGLGGGIVHEGKLIRGVTRLSAELGHVIVQVGGRKCGCGNKGCLEAYASKAGMGKFFKEQIVDKGRKSVLADDPDVDLANVRGGTLAKAYRAGDKVTVEGLNEAMDYLGIGVAGFLTSLGPDTVVLGGGVMEALGDALLDRVRKVAKEHTRPREAYDAAKIVLAELGDDSVALGAVAYARSCME